MTKRRRDNNRHKRHHHQALREARHPNSKAHREQPERRHKALKEVQHRDRYLQDRRQGQFSGNDQERHSKAAEVNLCTLIIPILTAYLLLSNLPNEASSNSLNFVPASRSSSSNSRLRRVLNKLL